MSSGYDETSRREHVREFRIGGGVRIKRVRILDSITIDDLMMNAVKAEAMRVKTGNCPAPEFDVGITDYLLRR